IEQAGKADMVFICRPNNPVGNCMSLEQLLFVFDECKKTNTFAVLDECFMDFVTEEKSAVKYIEDYDNILILKAFTKMFALPGVRLGYGICSNAEVIEKIYDVRQPWNVSHTAEMAGIVACGIYEDTVKKTRQFIEAERAFITSELKRLGVKYFEPSANYIFFKAYDGLKQDMAERSILIRACGNYSGLTNEFYRIAVRGREDNKRLISALEECLWQRR
ncbi:MAG: aminotransferase class I/II-fold pyridoxal phosphate-dependent enzyme, partial [Clostridiales bacterium]|nr:aminotransferase class I/II-fold pyridoxal phosphate-dependent enzyme [Clostridiales bacterium]